MKFFNCLILGNEAKSNRWLFSACTCSQKSTAQWGCLSSSLLKQLVDCHAVSVMKSKLLSCLALVFLSYAHRKSFFQCWNSAERQSIVRFQTHLSRWDGFHQQLFISRNRWKLRWGICTLKDPDVLFSCQVIRQRGQNYVSLQEKLSCNFGLSVSYRYWSSVTLALWPFEWSFRFQILLKVGCCTCPRCKDKLWWSTLGPVGFFEARRFGSPGLDGSGCPVGRSWESTHGKILRRRKLLSYESNLTNLYL